MQRSIFCHGNVTRAAARSVVAFPRALNGGAPKWPSLRRSICLQKRSSSTRPSGTASASPTAVRGSLTISWSAWCGFTRPAAARTALTRCTACQPASHQSHPATAVARWSAVTTGPVCMLRSAAYRSRRRGAQSVATATKTSTKVASSRLILDSRWWAGP